MRINNRKQPTKTYKIEGAGRYALSDFCYITEGKVFDALCSKRQGVLTIKNDGFQKKAIIISTGGDGGFNDLLSGHQFSVDAGNLSFIPVELLASHENKEYPEPVIFNVEHELRVLRGEGFFNVIIDNVPRAKIVGLWS